MYCGMEYVVDFVFKVKIEVVCLEEVLCLVIDIVFKIV